MENNEEQESKQTDHSKMDHSNLPAGKAGIQGMNMSDNMNSPTKDEHTEHH